MLSPACCPLKVSNRKEKMRMINQNNDRLWSELHSGNVISYQGPGLVNMSGVSVTNVRRFMSCVAIINTPISSV